VHFGSVPHFGRRTHLRLMAPGALRSASTPDRQVTSMRGKPRLDSTCS
jgi:hypothetical protein